MNQPITVVKRNPAGETVLRYTGMVLSRGTNRIVLEAFYKSADKTFMGTTWRRGDRFVETYFTDRWYNIFEIHDRDNDRLKGWYCNVASPAVLEEENLLSYIDLALDLWVAPDGTQTIFDEDEFAALDLDAETRSRARAALEELQSHFSNNKEPGLFYCSLHK